MEAIATIEAYIDGCNSGSDDEIAAALDRAAVHDFLPQSFLTVTGALAKQWRNFWLTLDPRWRVEHTLVARSSEMPAFPWPARGDYK